MFSFKLKWCVSCKKLRTLKSTNKNNLNYSELSCLKICFFLGFPQREPCAGWFFWEVIPGNKSGGLKRGKRGRREGQFKEVLANCSALWARINQAPWVPSEEEGCTECAVDCPLKRVKRWVLFRGMLEPACPSLAQPIAPVLPTLCPAASSWWLETDCGGSVYIMEIGECDKSGLFLTES